MKTNVAKNCVLIKLVSKIYKYFLFIHLTFAQDGGSMVGKCMKECIELFDMEDIEIKNITDDVKARYSQKIKVVSSLKYKYS